MKTTKKQHWEIFQPNPTEPKYSSTKGDCVIRAVCAALDIDWLDAFDILTEHARETYTLPNDPDVVARVLAKYGFVKVSVKREKGKKAPTPNALAEQFPDKVFVCRLSHHMVCVRGGKYWDTWQSGDKTIYNYYVKE